MRDLYRDRSVAVIGIARTGLAVAEVMKNLGAKVTLFDKKTEFELGESFESAKKLGVGIRAGGEGVDLDGMDLLVTSPGVPAGSPVFVEARKRGVEVISEIELAYRISKAPMVAITGTNGKTTTTVMVGRMTAASGRESYIAGNVAAGDIKLPLIMAAYKASEDAVIAAEISSFQLEWIETFRPKVAAVLNVTADHLDRHASIEEYASLKKRIFENQTSEDYSLINAENDITSSWSSDLNGQVLQFSTKREVEQGAFLRGDELVVRIDGRETVICNRSDIPLRGEHNIENVLAAGCSAVVMGIDAESIRRAVREFLPVEHRLEPVAIIDGVEYINNSMCTNVAAAVSSVEAINEPQIVISGGKDKGGVYAPLGEAFKRKAKHVVLIGADARLIEDAARKAGFDAITLAGSMREAVEAARALAEPGDVVVLTPGCASFDMFNSFEHRGRVFKEVVRGFEEKGRAGS